LTWVAQLVGVPLYGLVVVAAISYSGLLLSLHVLSTTEIRAVLRKEPL
jgi:hypothetical protein